MRRFETRYTLFLLFLVGLVVTAGCGSSGTALPAEPSPPATATQAASPSPKSTQPAGSAAPQPVETGTVEGEGSESGPSGLEALVPTLVDIAPTRTPVPTATPDALAEGVAEILRETGLSGKTLLWLQYADWINLGISLLYVLAGYLIGTWLIRWLFPRLVRRTATVLDDRLLQTSGSELRWLAVVLILGFSTNRLTFINVDTKSTLSDIYFSLTLILAVLILWRLIRLAAQQALDRAYKAGDRQQTEALITLLVWGLRLALLILALSFALAYFGVNITGFAVFLGVLGLALSLAGRDILADMISGAIILIDRPYRIGDRLELPSLDSWGDVVDIGMRSTRILSMENRMVVIPNSLVGKNQVVNYSYPDPSYFNLVKVVVAYDNDPDQVSNILETAIRSVEGVQTEREIVAWLMELTEYQMVYWTAWWVATYADRYSVQDRVIRAMMRALKEAGVILPYTKNRVRVEGNPRE